MPEYCYCFQVAGVTFRLRQNHEILVTENFSRFEGEQPEADITVTLTPTDALDWPSGQPLYSGIAFAVYPDPAGGFLRVYHDRKEHDRPYAIGRVAPDGRSETVEYLADSARFFSESQNTFSHIALEELLLHRERLILHASFVTSPWGGLLFSGPSGIGKSTQAELWARWMGSRVINGDRPILGREAGTWRAYGSPYAGSSRCFVNESLPIRTVVLLEQGPENRLERMPPGAAFHGLFAQLTVNSWNPWFVSRTLDLAADLMERMPVYRLTCTPDRRAVETLRRALEGGG